MRRTAPRIWDSRDHMAQAPVTAARPPARTLTLGGTSYPVILPSIRDPRLHVAAVIITIHVLGQVGPALPGERAADPRRDPDHRGHRGRPDLPPSTVVRVAGSAMLTGSGVALILRVVGTPPDDPWNTYAWYVFAGVAAFSLLTKYVIQYRGSHVFNPSNIGLVVAFVVLGSTRIEPLDFWWAPLNALDDPGLRRDHRRRAADHPAAAPARAGGDVLGRRWRSGSGCSPRRGTA